MPGLLVFAGTITPALAALAVAAYAGPLLLTKPPLRHLFRWRVEARWYVFAIGYMAAIKLTVALTHRLLTGSWPQTELLSVALILPAIVISTPIQSGEEIGWRGFALPHLTQRIGLAGASILLGLIWAVWHLPLFFLNVPGNNEFGQPFPVWALGVTALSVAIAWLYWRSGGSLLLTMLMHAAVNNTPHFVTPNGASTANIFTFHASPVSWLTAVVLWIPAAWFLYRMTLAKASDAALA